MKCKGLFKVGLKLVLWLLLLSCWYVLASLVEQPGLWFVFYLFSGVLLLSLLSLWRGRKSVQLLEFSPATLTQGQEKQVFVTLRLAQRLAYQSLKLAVGPTVIPLEAVGLMERQGVQQFRLRPARPLPRGRYQEMSLLLEVSDWLGFFTINYRYQLAFELQVLPAYLPAEAQQFKGMLQAQQQALSSLAQPSFEVKSLRTYREGDPFEQIDWKLSAKGEELIVREVEQEREQQLVFLYLGLEGQQSEKLLALMYTLQETYLAQLPQSEVFLMTTKGELLRPEKENFATVILGSESEQLLATLLAQPYYQQTIYLFLPRLQAELLTGLGQLARYNQIFLLSFNATAELVSVSLNEYLESEGRAWSN